MKNKIILFAKKIIFGLHLAIAWKLFDSVKFITEKKILQLKAGLTPGPNQLKKELAIFFAKEKAYQPFDGAGFADIPFSREGEKRFQIIKNNLSAKKGMLLDIGANLGYFCSKFESKGFDCYAVEENRMLCYFAEKLKKERNQRFKVIPQSIFEYNKNKEIVFDVALALSVFHNFLERKDTYLDLIKLLKRLKVKELFFETYLSGEFKAGKNYKNYTPEEFVNFIIENSSFKKAESIGSSENGRPIYKLTPLETTEWGTHVINK